MASALFRARTRRCGLLLVLLFGSWSAHAATPADHLSAREQRIVRAAEREVGPATAMLERIVNINSGTMNLDGVEAVGRIMMDQLSGLGFAVRWVPLTQIGRAGDVVAVHEGTGHGRRILLIGHLDTVFEKDSPFQKFERRGSTAIGPGVNDMKDGLCIMVAALRALKEAGALEPATVTVVLGGDEERAGEPLSVSRAELIRAAGHSDVALEFEALATENGHDMGSISRRSSSSWTVRTEATSGHSSGIFSEESGDGAAYEIARILAAFRTEIHEPNATYNVGLMGSGSSVRLGEGDATLAASGKPNIIPAQGIARGDLRTLSPDQTARIEAQMQAIVAAHLHGTDAQITFDESYPPMPPTAGNRALLARLNEINAALGLEAMKELDPMRRGAGDISFVADRVDGLVGFGGAGHGAHAPGETLDLTSLDRQIKRTALLIGRLSAAR